MLERVSVAIFGCAALILTPTIGNAQDSSCQLSIEGSGTSNVFISASGCTGDTIDIVAGAEGNQKQFSAGNGPDIYHPFNVSQCDLDVSADHSVGVNYTLVVVSGPDMGKSSTTYSGTLDPDPKLPDKPPSVSLGGAPSPGFVRPGEVIALSVSANDDYGVTEIKVTDDNGKVLLDDHPKPPSPSGSKCHPGIVPHTNVTPDISKTYTVPSNPPAVIRFHAWARDTAGQEATSTVEYLTEATWTVMMLLDGSGSARNNICTTKWRMPLTVKTTTKIEVTGTAEAFHPPLACKYAGPRDSAAPMSFAITGTFDGKLFRLYFKPTAGASIAWGIAGLHLLALPSPLPVELMLAPGDRDYAKGSIGRDNSGNVEGQNATASLAGSAFLQCCFSESAPAAPAKTPPIFIGEDGEQMHLGGDR